ncbi:carboxylating nicotinate-nucleotide diphosphorylase [Calycomorphotria hydatis]|uniref:Probable nicotinate-nucleotide pyrophosphorylase [carboxylating] n=1 Tax=Calycomorphotria hydatis TaxID=2528027 RepID=A0A517T3U6_9PLAN|nr:carboxylating nicotinate-nucleotide diphosphorylase [Calycomorphotria hydatis]QDT63050.1 Nicotinate-nucleotide pyrophosphorylase [carboxylating] [Calycomorphotria hydatis]
MWAPIEEEAAKNLIDLALAEDLGRPPRDVTSEVMIPAEQTGTVSLVARDEGVLAGLPAAQLVFQRLLGRISFEEELNDGATLTPGSVVVTMTGDVRTLLAGERTLLNLVTHLSGIATLTRKYVDAVADTDAVILDTRKTIPAYRLLAKYAVRKGGGTNHRMGLYDGCLIKDNHLAARLAGEKKPDLTKILKTVRNELRPGLPLEVEVDTLDQFKAALPAKPDIILLDNMSNELLRKAVKLRDRDAPEVLLEASGGVNLSTVHAIAETGVDRISVGALTHSAPTLDLGFDWAEVA